MAGEVGGWLLALSEFLPGDFSVVAAAVFFSGCGALDCGAGRCTTGFVGGNRAAIMLEFRVCTTGGGVTAGLAVGFTVIGVCSATAVSCWLVLAELFFSVLFSTGGAGCCVAVNSRLVFGTGFSSQV